MRLEQRRYVSLKLAFIRFSDVCSAPATLLGALWLKMIRRVGVQRMPVSLRMLRSVGVFPIRDHYYEPAFKFDGPRQSLGMDRSLPGIAWNIDGQLSLLAKMHYQEELRALENTRIAGRVFSHDNGSFGAGDAEMLYNIVRHVRPRKIIEVGSGFSTMVSMRATERNKEEGVACALTCIEPYEQPWLEGAGVEVIRRPVEEVDFALFDSLGENDILFIDSSHVVRPQGDVVKIYLEILPRLKPGVIVHVHDIFSPCDYPATWVIDEVRLWGEQYLLEAFLSFNRDFVIMCSLNYLARRYTEYFAAACPIFGSSPSAYNPGSFWIRRN